MAGTAAEEPQTRHRSGRAQAEVFVTPRPKTPRVRGISRVRGPKCCLCGERGGAQFIEQIKKYLHPYCVPAYIAQTKEPA